MLAAETFGCTSNKTKLNFRWLAFVVIYLKRGFRLLITKFFRGWRHSPGGAKPALTITFMGQKTFTFQGLHSVGSKIMPAFLFDEALLIHAPSCLSGSLSLIELKDCGSLNFMCTTAMLHILLFVDLGRITKTFTKSPSLVSHKKRTYSY